MDAPRPTWVRRTVAAHHGAAGVGHVGEHAAWAEEDIVLTGDAGVEADVVLNLAVAAEHHIGADDDVLANVAPVSQHCAGHDVAEMPNARARSDGTAVVDDRRFMGEPTVVFHQAAHLL